MPERWERELSRLGESRPQGDLLQRARLGPMHPDPPPAHRGRRLLAGVVAFAVLAAAGVVLWRALEPVDREPGPAGSPKAGRFVDPAFSWSVDVPDGMQIRHLEGNGMFELDGVIISNFDATPTDESAGSPDFSAFRRFPAGGVAIAIWFGERRPYPAPNSFPLPLRPVFRLIRPYVGGSEPAPMYLTFGENGFDYSVAEWSGPDAGSGDRAALEQVLDSLEFPPVEEGTIWQSRYYVLGPAEQYPVGSVTRIDAADLPTEPNFAGTGTFYLVHAPHGFYVVKADDQERGVPACDIRFDAAAFEFSCPEAGFRWDREGRPITGPRGRERSSIGPFATVLATDGHVLFCPWFGAGVGVDRDPWTG